MIAQQQQQPLDITVLMGGPSSEREVSLMSGQAIADGLEAAGHAVTRSDISPQDTAALDRPGAELFFIALHGEFGENGEVQQLCEERGLRYTGSGPTTSRLGMDKAASKQIFKRAGLSTPDWMIIERFHDPAVVCKWLEEIPLPVVAKPVDGGSSVDIAICRDERTRIGVMEELIDTYGRVMIERFVPGREMTVGVLGEEALPVLEILPTHDFYDYTAKYADDAGTQYTFEHGLDATVTYRMKADALTAHRSLGCRDLSRVDFILDEEGCPQVLEINTIPGFTSHSLLPKAAQEQGIDFSQLVDRIARMAMQREPVSPVV
jgi:D-alanine-D-alanine ligase